jgi:hypothetical protein
LSPPAKRRGRVLVLRGQQSSEPRNTNATNDRLEGGAAFKALAKGWILPKIENSVLTAA